MHVRSPTRAHRLYAGGGLLGTEAVSQRVHQLVGVDSRPDDQTTRRRGTSTVRASRQPTTHPHPRPNRNGLRRAAVLAVPCRMLVRFPGGSRRVPWRGRSATATTTLLSTPNSSRSKLHAPCSWLQGQESAGRLPTLRPLAVPLTHAQPAPRAWTWLSRHKVLQVGLDSLTVLSQLSRSQPTPPPSPNCE